MKEWASVSCWLWLVCLTGCASVPPRPAPSTVGCAQVIVRERLPAGLDDKARHCLATGLIARHCSRTEAILVAGAKEVRDVFGRGDAEWADWEADRAGLRCAQRDGSDAALLTCCRERA